MSFQDNNLICLSLHLNFRLYQAIPLRYGIDNISGNYFPYMCTEFISYWFFEFRHLRRVIPGESDPFSLIQPSPLSLLHTVFLISICISIMTLSNNKFKTESFLHLSIKMMLELHCNWEFQLPNFEIITDIFVRFNIFVLLGEGITELYIRCRTS